jgi:hypothetical protein
MRLLLPFLLASLLALAVPLTTSAGSQHGGAAAHVFCEHPHSLHLHRFEDRSARLECGGRIIVRVSVPG